MRRHEERAPPARSRRRRRHPRTAATRQPPRRPRRRGPRRASAGCRRLDHGTSGSELVARRRRVLVGQLGVGLAAAAVAVASRAPACRPSNTGADGEHHSFGPHRQPFGGGRSARRESRSRDHLAADLPSRGSPCCLVTSSARHARASTARPLRIERMYHHIRWTTRGQPCHPPCTTRGQPPTSVDEPAARAWTNASRAWNGHKPPHVAIAPSDATTTSCGFGLDSAHPARVSFVGSPDRTETPKTLPAGPIRRSRSGPQGPFGSSDDTMDAADYAPPHRDGMEERADGSRQRDHGRSQGSQRAKAQASGRTDRRAAPPRPAARHAGPYGASFDGTGRTARPGPRPDLRAPLDPPGRPSLRRDHLGVPDRRHRQRDPARPSSSRRTSRSPTSGASSPPTSSSASTSAATSARRSARPRVRQLIDRVVNTITAWAETQHYFATDADLADLQGRADPPPRPPEDGLQLAGLVQRRHRSRSRSARACFINSVQDTMSSIMDLAKTEAMLFKFGSGAGSNLSTIRSLQGEDGRRRHRLGPGLAS